MANPKTRVFRVSSSSKAAIVIEDEQVRMIGNKDHFIVCDGKGISMKGPVSFISDSMSRRTLGVFAGINDFLEQIPQTIITPIPSKIPFPPVFILKNVVQDIAFFLALLV